MQFWTSTTGTPQDNLNHVWSRIQSAYGSMGSTADTYKKITLSMFNNGPGVYPMMRGKAGCIRTFNKVLHTVWLEGLNPSDDMHVRVALLLETSICIDEIVSSHTRVFKLPAAVADTLFAKTCLYCQLATSLSNYAGVKLFNVTQTFHFLVHIGWSARYINPRISWCWMGEDYMAKMRTLFQSCVKGSRPEAVVGKAARKLMVAMHMTHLQ